MNQIKYLIYSLLLLVVLYTGYFIFSIIVESEKKVYLPSTVIDNVKPTPTVTQGKKLFQQNCQSCHSINKKLSGPALAGVTERGPWTNKLNLYKWIKNPGAFISTTSYTKALQAEYGIIMPAFPQLSEQEIDEILSFISQDVQLTTAYARPV
jgi:mono/diheme cytochrome c family protein